MVGLAVHPPVTEGAAVKALIATAADDRVKSCCYS